MRRLLVTTVGVVVLLATGAVAGFAVGGTGTVEPPPRIAFLANGRVPADALAAGPLAGRLGAAMFTTESDSLVAAAQAGIEAFEPDLVIVLGGPGAISDAVLDRLSSATALPILRDEQVDDEIDGIVRVAGQDRFATARAVAELIDVLRPGFLPVDATAVGASTAGDADTLGGLGPTAFARSDVRCSQGRVVTGVAADGTPECADPSTVVVGRFRSTFQVTVGIPQGGGNFTADTLENSSGSAKVAFVEFDPPIQAGRNAELVDLTICTGTDSENLTGSVFMSVFDDTGSGTGSSVGAQFADNTCTTVAPTSRLITSRETRLTVSLAVEPNSTASVRSIHATFAPTDDPTG